MTSHRWRLLLLTIVAGAFVARSLSAQTVPNDPEYPRQRYLETIHAPAAWAVERGSRDVVIAVLSSGVTAAHRDLAANIWLNPRPGAAGCGVDTTGCNFSASSGGTADCLSPTRENAPSPDVRDQTGLGTALAGIAGAATSNGLDIAGVAWNVRLMPVKVTGCLSPTADREAAAIGYAADHGARIILLGVENENGAPGCTAPPPNLAGALRDALSRGVIVIAGSGSGGGECVEGLAAQPGVIAVGATAVGADGTVSRASFSQAGAEVALAAPGVNIVGTVPSTGCRFCDPSGVRTISGTAPAAALTAGAAALLLSRDPVLGLAEVRDLLTRGATPLANGRAWAGAGLLDLARSLSLVPASVGGVVRGAAFDANTPAVISASVGGTRCAEAPVIPRDGSLTYLLHVPPAATQVGCGVPGAQVTLRAGATVIGSVTWRPGAQIADLQLPPAPEPSVSPAPASIPTPLPSPLASPPAPQPTPAPIVLPAPAPALEFAPPSELKGSRTSNGAELLGIILSNAIDADFAITGPTLERFTADDIQVVLWTNWGGEARRRDLRFAWGRPDGTLYRQVDLSDDCPCVAATRWRLDSPGPNGGDRILDHPGVWQIDIYMDGDLVGSVQFRIDA